MFHGLLATAIAFACAGSAVGQTTVQLTGTVTDPSGKPVAGARVDLASQGLSDITDGAGRYRLTRMITGIGDSSAASSRIRWREGGISLSLDAAADVRVELFSLEGRRLATALSSRLPAGAYALNPFRDAAPGRAYLVRISAGSTVETFRAAWLGGSRAPALARRGDAEAPLLKASAAGDTLTLLATGYQREDRGVASLSGIEDFKLKVAGTANVPYKTGANLSPYEVERCRLDVHIPANAAGKKLPVVLHFHGGGLHGGDKNEGWFDGDNWFSRKLMEEGLILFSANYRFSQDPDLPKDPKRIVHPEYLRDAASAVAWVRRNLESYGGDPKNFYVSGFSAGAWLAAMLAVDTSFYKAEGFKSHDVNGYLCWSAQTYTYGQIAYERGISDRGITDGALLGHVRKHDVPMALFVGGNEGQRISDMQTWHKQMLDAGSTNMTLSVQAGRDHKQLVTTMGNAVDDTRAKAMAFIRQYSK